MKKVLAVFTLTCSFAMLASAGEWTGYIADAKCAKNAKKVASDGHAGCASGCIKGGEKAVLVTDDGKVVKIADSMQAKVVEHAGHKVTISGTADGDTITAISDVKM